MTNSFKRNYKTRAFLAILTLFNISCKDFVDVGTPKNHILGSEVFQTDAAATSAMVGIYSKMMSGGLGFASGGSRSITVFAGMSADELTNFNNNYVAYERNDLLSSTPMLDVYIWNEAYRYIFSANAILEGLQTSDKLTEMTKKQLMGEAYFVRAFCYFYLVNLFGPVPLHFGTDYSLNAITERMPENIVNQHIITDLEKAANLLNDNYPTADRVRPNRATAKALLARTHLYMKNWTAAETESTQLINQKSLYNLVTDLDKVFLKTSGETIWQLMPVVPGNNTNEGSLFILTSKPLTASLNKTLYLSFSDKDKRKSTWIGTLKVGTDIYYYPHKYKVKTGTAITEYYVVFRLTEQYLIHAEALVMQGRADDAVKDLNLIRKRSGLDDLPQGLSPTDVIKAIAAERRAEFFAEWGHRWFDLKRTDQVSIILEPLKGDSWQETDVLYPIPQAEIDRNPRISQNNGY